MRKEENQNQKKTEKQNQNENQKENQNENQSKNEKFETINFDDDINSCGKRRMEDGIGKCQM
jgi:hypothetical protein